MAANQARTAEEIKELLTAWKAGDSDAVKEVACLDNEDWLAYLACLQADAATPATDPAVLECLEKIKENQEELIGKTNECLEEMKVLLEEGNGDTSSMAECLDELKVLQEELIKVTQTENDETQELIEATNVCLDEVKDLLEKLVEVTSEGNECLEKIKEILDAQEDVDDTDDDVRGVAPACYQWEGTGGINTFFGYAKTKEDGSFDGWEVLSGAAPSSVDEVTCLDDLKPECREAQEWSFGIDNTGTRFNDVATYEIGLSDGSTISFEQAGGSASWTQQLTEWAANIQQSADDAGLVWFVEPRFVDTYNPANIDGTINGPGGTPSGLPGAPSEVIAVALDAGGMAWRYVNFQICPGQPVPVSAKRLTSATYGDDDFDLTAAGPVLGPVKKFKVCVTCGERADQWYVLDESAGGLYRPANAGEIPNCWEPCGVLSQLPPPPSQDCSFLIDVACDNNGSANTVDFTNTITRRSKVCNGEQIGVDYFEADPNDPAALIPYTLVGDFVDCATGEPIPVVQTEGVVIDCDETIQPESFDQDVRIVGAKNPIPVFQVAQCGPYIRTEDVKLCEKDARFLLLIDSTGVFGRYSFFTGEVELVNTLSVSSAGGSADVENFILYNFVAPDQLTVIDVNTDTQLPNVTLIDGVINPAVATNPKTFSAASFRQADGYLYAQDTAGADRGIYKVNVTTGEVDFVTNYSGVSGTGTSIAIDNTTDTLYVNGSNISYEVDWVTGVGTAVANPPIQPNGSTFDTDGNWYVTQNANTYYLPAGVDGTDPDNWVQIIDDFGAGANSLAYYEVVAPQPSCFFRRYGILEDGSRVIIGDFNVADDSPRTIVGDVDCCDSCGKSEGTTVTSSAEEAQGIELASGNSTTLPVGVRSFTVTAQTGTFDVTGGGINLTSRRGSRTWGQGNSDVIENSSAITVTSNGDVDVIWEA